MNFKYKGNVRLLKLDSNDSIIKTIDLHNNGTNNLFKFFAKCLVGELNRDAQPSYIDIRSRFSSGDSGISVVSYTFNAGCPIISASLNEVTEDDDTTEIKYVAAQFVAHISNKDLVGNKSGLDENTSKGLYLTITGNDNSIELAEVKLTADEYNDITDLLDGQKTAIEWTMLVRNFDSEE